MDRDIEGSRRLDAVGGQIQCNGLLLIEDARGFDALGDAVRYHFDTHFKSIGELRPCVDRRVGSNSAAGDKRLTIIRDRIGDDSPPDSTLAVRGDVDFLRGITHNTKPLGGDGSFKLMGLAGAIVDSPDQFEPVTFDKLARSCKAKHNRTRRLDR